MDAKKSIRIYDCTLREGGQASGISFSLSDKLRITQLLDDMGFAYTEGGWPNSNVKDRLYFEDVKKLRLKHIQVVGFGRTKSPNVAPEDDDNLSSLIRTGVGCGHVFGKGWDFHVREVLRVPLNQNLDLIFESIRYLKKHMEEVSFGFEHFFDAYKSNPDYSLQVLQAAVDAGVDWIDLADTNGGCFPDEIAHIVSTSTKQFHVPFAVHSHNDTGCAVANTIAAVRSGVTIVEGTINGYSERCGIADLCTLIPNLQLKLGYKCIPDENLKYLKKLSEEIADLLQVDPPKWHPYVGSLAFTHKGGVHVDAFLKNPRTYEHIDPTSVGNQSNVVISETSGKDNLTFFLNKYGLAGYFSDDEIKNLLGVIKELELSGFDFNTVEESLLLFILRESKRFTTHIDFKSNSLTFINGPSTLLPTEQASSSHGGARAGLGSKLYKSIETHKIRFNAVVDFIALGQVFSDQRLSISLEHEEAFFSFITTKIIAECSKYFPELKGITLVDYNIRTISDGEGKPHRVRVILEFRDAKERGWRALGLGKNVVGATLNATVDALEYRLNMDEISKNLGDGEPLRTRESWHHRPLETRRGDVTCT